MSWQLGVAGALLALVLALGGLAKCQSEKIGVLNQQHLQDVARIKEANANVEKCSASLKTVLEAVGAVTSDPAGAWNGLLDSLRTVPKTPGANPPAPGKGGV